MVRAAALFYRRAQRSPGRRGGARGHGYQGTWIRGYVDTLELVPNPIEVAGAKDLDRSDKPGRRGGLKHSGHLLATEVWAPVVSLSGPNTRRKHVVTAAARRKSQGTGSCLKSAHVSPFRPTIGLRLGLSEVAEGFSAGSVVGWGSGIHVW